MDIGATDPDVGNEPDDNEDPDGGKGSSGPPIALFPRPLGTTPS